MRPKDGDPQRQLEDWEVWECARCGREVVQESRPHKAPPPQCCGTTMWWIVSILLTAAQVRELTEIKGRRFGR